MSEEEPEEIVIIGDLEWRPFKDVEEAPLHAWLVDSDNQWSRIHHVHENTITLIYYVTEGSSKSFHFVNMNFSEALKNYRWREKPLGGFRHSLVFGMPLRERDLFTINATKIEDDEQ